MAKSRKYSDLRADVTRARELADKAKDSTSIHFDEDTIPHGDCSDPIKCDCCCPCCWGKKAAIIDRGLNAAMKLGAASGFSARH